jgi:hypothetical protein
VSAIVALSTRCDVRRLTHGVRDGVGSRLRLGVGVSEVRLGTSAVRQRDVGTNLEAANPGCARLLPRRRLRLRERGPLLLLLLAAGCFCVSTWTGVVLAAPPGATATPQQAAPPRPPALGRWLAETFGEGKARSTFVPELRRLLAQVRQRLAALRALSARYPPSSPEEADSLASAPRAALGAVARARLDRQVRLLYGALRTDLEALDARFSVLFGSTARGLPASELPADWRQRTEAAAGYAATLDGLVQQLLLTHDDLAAGDADGMEARTARSFAALWDAINPPPPQAAATQ